MKNDKNAEANNRLGGAGVIKKNDVKTKNAYGLYIQIVENIKMDESDAEHVVEVCIDYKGQIKEYTCKEFVEKLGFNFSLKLSSSPAAPVG